MAARRERIRWEDFPEIRAEIDEAVTDPDINVPQVADELAKTHKIPRSQVSRKLYFERVKRKESASPTGVSAPLPGDEEPAAQDGEPEQAPVPVEPPHEIVRDLGRKNQRLEGDLRRAKQQLKAEREESGSYELIAQAIRDITPALPKGRVEIVRGTRSRERVPVVNLSDWHAGEVVHPSVTEGLNAYNMDICRRRVWGVVKKVRALIDDARGRVTINRGVIAISGDMISGGIHEELRETNECDPVVGAFWTGQLLGQAIWYLAELCEWDVVAVPGNHGRLTNRIKFKLPTESWDFAAYLTAHQHLSALIEDGRVRWELRPRWVDGFVAFQRLFLVAHGNAVRGQLGIPYYGLDRYVAYLRAQQQAKDFRSLSLGETLDSVGVYRLIIGHFHQTGAVKDVLLNGSLKGIDEYSTANKYEPAPATQTAFFVDEKYPLCQIEPLYVDDPPEDDGFDLPEVFAWRPDDPDAQDYTVAA